jgi:hypothetical protein
MIVNLERLSGGGLCDVCDRFLASPIDRSEVQNDISLCKNKVAQDCVDTRGGIGYKDASVYRGVDEGCDSLSRHIQCFRIGEANKAVRFCLAFVLRLSQCISDNTRVSAETS